MSASVGISNPVKDEAIADAVYAMPATPLQVRLWNREQKTGADAAWNVAVRFRLSGSLDRERLERALQLLTARHEVLRTSLELHQDEIVACIAGRVTLPVEWCDLRRLQTEAQTSDAMHLSVEHARQSLPLTSAPLFRVRVLRLSDDEHLMVWNAHHAICDGWSVGLLAQDLMHCYGELLAGREPAPQDSLDYGDYAVWLDAYRRTPEYEAHRRYWQNQLGGVENLELPTSWRNPETFLANPVIHSTVLPKMLTHRLGEIAQQHNATFFHAALAAFSVLMRMQQGSPEVVIGTPVSGREQTELEGIVGTFVNYVPLHLRIDSEIEFHRLLPSVRDLVTDSLEHASYRFEDMLADLEAPAASMSEVNSLFSVAFICQQDFVRPVSAGGVALAAVPSVSSGAVRPLTVFMVERPDGWRLSCEVDNHTVSAVCASAILDDFERLLTAIVRYPEESVPLLAARAGLVHAVQNVPVEIIPVASEHPQSGGGAAAETRRTQETRRIPATEAQFRFCMLDRTKPGDTSYDLRIRLELEGALSIDALRAAAEKLVERNEILRTTLQEEDGQVWQVIHPQSTTNFQFLKAGEASSDMDDGGNAFSLTDGPLFRIRVTQIADDRHTLAITLSHAIADGWSSGVFLDQLRQAYEQCLSGACDEVRGIPLQFSSYAAEEQSLLASPEKDRRLAWWSEHLQGTWMPLELPQDAAQKDGAAAAQGEHSHATLTSMLEPSIVLSARRFARESNTTLFAVFGAAFQALLARYSGQSEIFFLTPFANRTEETETMLGPLAIPVCLTGRIASQTTYRELVDTLSSQSMGAIEHALPLGMVAPLMDMRVVKGYHALNQITFFYQRAFVHDMQWPGLQVRSLPDLPAATGSEWQLGVVERDAGVSVEFQYDARLYSRQTMDLLELHYARLLARAVIAPDMPLSQLQFITPEEMTLASAGGPLLPITQSLFPGQKITPPIEIVTSPESQFPASPRTQSERDMLRIWEQIFKIENINSDSNFFDLGGHSLLLARLQITIQKKFNVQLMAADVFRNPTVAELADWLDRAKADGVVSEIPRDNPRIIPIQPLGADRPLFVISQSMIFRTMAAELGTNQPVIALQMLDEDISPENELVSVEHLAEFYLRLIRQVQPKGPYRLAGWCVSGWIAYEIARQIESQNEKVDLLMIMDAWAPAYWRKQPRMRHAAMQAIYRGQRFRWVARRLGQSSSADRRLYIRRSLHGMAAAAARNLTAWLHRMHVPVQVRLTEEMRRSEQLEYTASRVYEPGSLQGPVLLFRSEEQPVGPLLAPDMGWARTLGRPITVEQLPGDHHEIFDLPGARIMAVHAREVLEKVSSGNSDVSVASANTERLFSARHTPMVEA